MSEITWEQVLAWRMARHHLVHRAARADLLRVAGDICGLHAQLLSSAELSLWVRVDGLTRGCLEEVLWTRRELVKLWAQRGTLHLLPADELGLWLAALGTISRNGNLGHAGIDRLSAAIDRVLAGRTLAREELALAIEQETGDPELAEWVRFSWGSYLKAAAFRGLLCFAPSAGASVRFTSPAHWLGRPVDRPDPALALREVTRRFLGAYAPTTADELALWWGDTVTRVRRGMLGALGDEITEVEIEGTRGWALARDVAAMRRAVPADVARLLPAFDPWVAGASRAVPALLEPRWKVRVYRPQGWLSPVLLVNGRMAGVWKHRQQGRGLSVELEPFAPLPAWAREQLEGEAERLAVFLGGALALRWVAEGVAAGPAT